MELEHLVILLMYKLQDKIVSILLICLNQCFFFIGPTVPRSLMVDSVTDTTMTLSWIIPDPTNGIITQYQLQYRRCTGGSYTSLLPFSTEVTRTVTGLVVNTEYCFRVRAYTVISLGPSEWTDEARGRTCKSHMIQVIIVT